MNKSMGGFSLQCSTGPCNTGTKNWPWRRAMKAGRTLYSKRPTSVLCSIILSHGIISLSVSWLVPSQCSSCWTRTYHHNDWKLIPLLKDSLFINNHFVSRSYTIYTAHTNASARWLWLSYDTVLIRSEMWYLSSRGSITVVRTHNNYASRLCPYLPWQEPWRTLAWIRVLNQTLKYIYGGRDVLRLDNHVHRQSRLDRLVCCLSKASFYLLLVLILALRSKRTEQTGSTTPWTTRRSLHWPCKTSSFGRLVQDLRFLEKGIR